MNRRRWIIAGVIVLAGVAFAVDRFVIGGPGQASARPQGPRRSNRERIAAPAQLTVQPKTSPAAAPLPAPQDPTVERLAGLPEAGSTRDIFSPTGGMLQVYQQAEEPRDHQQKGPRPGSNEAFETGHKLQATFVAPGGGAAVVSGRTVRIGEQLDGFQLSRVDAFSAEFRRGRDRVRLTLPQAGASPH